MYSISNIIPRYFELLDMARAALSRLGEGNKGILYFLVNHSEDYRIFNIDFEYFPVVATNAMSSP